MFSLSFGNGITLVHFEQQVTRIFEASDHLDCQYIRSYFKKQGTATAQYIQSNLSNLYDTVEDLIGLGNGIMAFHVTYASYPLCKKLTYVLKELDDRIRIVWFGEIPLRNSKEILKQTEVDGCVIWEPEQTLHSLLNLEVDKWWKIPGVSSRSELEQGQQAEKIMIDKQDEMIDVNELDQLPGSWEETTGRHTKMVSVKWADRQGNPAKSSKGLRTHSPERLKRDLEHIVRHTVHAQPCFSIEGFNEIKDPLAKEEMLSVLEEMKHLVSYQVTITMEELKLPFLRRLAKAGMVRLNIKIPMSIGVESSLNYEHTNYMRAWKQSDERVSFTVTLVEMKEEFEIEEPIYTAMLLQKWIENGLVEVNDIRAESEVADKILNRIELPEPIAELIFEQLVNKSEKAQINGYLAYMTGHYPQQTIGGGVKHIGFTDGDWPAKFADRLGNLTGLNSALLFEENQVIPDGNKDLIYYDQDGVWKQENSKFNQLIGEASMGGYYLSNAHQMNRLGEYDYQLQMNDFLHTEPIYIRQMDYLQAEERDLATEDSDVEFQMLAINTESDLEIFLQDVEWFSQSGTFLHGYEVESYLVDSCRWSGDQHCRAKHLPRLFVDEHAQVSSCRGCSAIGSLNDSLDSLLTKTAVITEQEQLLRGCSTCEIKNTCSKCTFLPSYMNRQQYCDIRKKHKLLHRYMQMIRLLKGLRQYSQVLNGISVHDIRVSLQTRTHLWPRSLKGSGQSIVVENVFLFFAGDSPMIYHDFTQKMLELSEPMALILEALIIGVDEREIKQELMMRYLLDSTNAASVFSQAKDLFIREGCLKVSVGTI
ncbi:hypothetical protein [Paenibacillus crassostreae]|uniref:Uncharacterized protein n=1 Tax=Paenibacillus crassostreae TaxID=1763538 RepID=A0A167EVF5_9BACL|nr:hypothetical protein [Paenibacillus crassostreae]AOZ93430.1 hypothetical protein LPB68_15285 [Paenibacillus crassostreae]OAB75915.1 hypothetical protein PNBC_07735 [Paenibacillus crassostreae]